MTTELCYAILSLHFLFVPVDGKCFVNILYIYSNKFYDISKGKRSQSYLQR